MSRNIKEIGKELMGKSLNSFHRKTGLTQLEENNKMQDGILDGILSQVDDAYIEKTEQSNVIHLDGSGDGVVVLDSIEGNTMVNLIDYSTLPASHINQTWNRTNNGIEVIFNGQRDVVWKDNIQLKANTVYTIIYDLETTMTTDAHITGETSVVGHFVYNKSEKANWYNKYYTSSLLNIREEDIGVKFTNKVNMSFTTREESYLGLGATFFNTGASGVTKFNNLILLEGDWTNKEVNYFDGLQSSFEEKVNDEGKYEIEILSQNRNLLSKDSWQLNDSTLVSETKDEIVTKGKNNIGGGIRFTLKNLKEGRYCFSISAKTNTQGDGSVRIYNETKKQYIAVHLIPLETSLTYKTGFFTIPKDYERDEILIWIGKNSNYELETQFTLKKDFMLTRVSTDVSLPYEEQKQNKIKLLINEPLRSTPHNISDRLCIKDKRLVVERKCGEITLDGSEDWTLDQCFETFGQVKIGHIGFDRKNKPRNKLYSTTYTQCKIYSDNIKNASKLVNNSTKNLDTVFAGDNEHYALFVKFKNSTLGLSDGVDVGNFISKVKEYLRNKNVTVVYELATPYYEEVTNEYGEPIILEGYENGTIYIDSTIIPITSIRYTPKMESFKALKEVNNNNIMLTNDVNDNIIPYMMDVDLMIMEKEMALMSHKNIRTIGVKDMTSMQKRTQDMLTRLIKGKTLTEQECKTRVVTYLDAGKITDAQADELMLLISEVYA